MSGYTLSRLWFSFAYDNKDVKPVHTALYFWIVERANNSGWKKILDIQTEKSMECLGVTDWRTYKNALQFLVDNGFIKWIEKSRNQYTCNRITLEENPCELSEHFKNAYASNAEPCAEAIAEALAEAYAEPTVKAIAEALQSYINLKTVKPKKIKTQNTAPPGGEGNSKEDKDKPLTFRDMFELCRGIYPGTKRGLATEFEDFEKKNKGEFTIDFFRLIYQGIQTKKKTNEALAAADSFVPEWPHLKTYLNQRRWEEETPQPIKQVPFKEPTAFKTMQDYHDYWGNGTAKPITNPLPA